MLPLRVYLDENVPHSLYGFLVGRGIAVTTAQGQQTRSLPNDDQLRFAAAHGLVLLTTNVRHFHRWHQAFRTRGEEHGGIITVPQDDQLPERLHERSALLITWAATFATTQNALFRCVDLQTRMYGGYVPGDYHTDEIDLALGRAAGNAPGDEQSSLPVGGASIPSAGRRQEREQGTVALATVGVPVWPAAPVTRQEARRRGASPKLGSFRVHRWIGPCINGTTFEPKRL